MGLLATSFHIKFSIQQLHSPAQSSSSWLSEICLPHILENKIRLHGGFIKIMKRVKLNNAGKGKWGQRLSCKQPSCSSPLLLLSPGWVRTYSLQIQAKFDFQAIIAYLSQISHGIHLSTNPKGRMNAEGAGCWLP